MAKPALSTKRIQIDKSQANMVIFVAIAAFITVFSLVSAKALLGKRSFLSRVVTEKEKTLSTLKSNNDAASKLQASYKVFNDTPNNLLGGNPSGTGDKDGENAELILDALPSRYDFPGLTSSIEKMIKGQGGSIDSITGLDDEIAQGQSVDSSKPIEMPFEVEASSNPDAIQSILKTFGKSIRPINIVKLTLAAEDSKIRTHVTAKSYYQPKKTLEITTKVVK
jgi:hypothetical protein